MNHKSARFPLKLISGWDGKNNNKWWNVGRHISMLFDFFWSKKSGSFDWISILAMYIIAFVILVVGWRFIVRWDCYYIFLMFPCTYLIYKYTDWVRAARIFLIDIYRNVYCTCKFGRMLVQFTQIYPYFTHTPCTIPIYRMRKVWQRVIRVCGILFYISDTSPNLV